MPLFPSKRLSSQHNLNRHEDRPTAYIHERKRLETVKSNKSRDRHTKCTKNMKLRRDSVHNVSQLLFLFFCEGNMTVFY